MEIKMMMMMMMMMMMNGYEKKTDIYGVPATIYQTDRLIFSEICN
jgi:hypothetical protein